MFLIVIPSFYPSTYYGGPAISLFNFTKALSQLNPEKKFLVVTSNADGYKQLDYEDGKVVFYADNFEAKYFQVSNITSDSISFYKGIYSNLKYAEIVYLGSVFSFSSMWAFIIALISNKKIVLAPMGQVDSEMISLKSGLIKKLWLKVFINPFSKKIIWHAKSEYESKAISKLIKNPRVIVAPNGYWKEEVKLNYLNRTAFFKKYQINKDINTFVISSFSRLHFKKGFDILLKAFKILCENYSSQSDFLLIIAGQDNGEKQKIFDLIESLDLKEHVLFLEYLGSQEKVNVLKNSDFFALASRGENFGQVYLEALACGTPIITTYNTPWTKVQELGIGYCSNCTVVDFFEALEKAFLVNGTISMETCQKFAEENFEWSSVAQSFIKQLNGFLQ